MKKYILSSVLILFVFVFISCDEKVNVKVKKVENTADYKKVEAAILDYVEGIYLVDSLRVIRSVDSSLRKVGYWFHPKEKKYRDNLEMSYQQLVKLSANWNKDGKRTNENSPKEIVIYDVNTKTASAKLTAEWGIDLFHLAKVNNQWKIINVIWQSQPKEEN